MDCSRPTTIAVFLRWFLAVYKMMCMTFTANFHQYYYIAEESTDMPNTNIVPSWTEGCCYLTNYSVIPYNCHALHPCLTLVCKVNEQNVSKS
jgi:hypothetical protein